MAVKHVKPIIFQSNAHKFIAKDEAISVRHGGTGIVKVDEGELLFGSAADSLQALPAVATPGLRAYLSQILPSEGSETPSTTWRSAANLYTDIKPSIADDFIPYQNASKNVDLNKKDLVNVANLAIGTSIPDASLHVVREIAGSVVSQDVYINTQGGAAIRMRKARGSFLSPAAALNNDVAGGFVTQYYDGTDFGNAAAIRIRATQNQTPTKHGAKIAFETVANDTTTLVERMVIQHDGKVGIGTTDPLDIFHVHNGVNPAHVYFSSSRESAGAAATFNLMNKHTGSYTRFAHRLYGNPLREQSLLTTYDANTSEVNQLLIFDLLDKSLAIGQGAANISLMPSNNVGINTSNPQKTLHVNGTMRLTEAPPVTELKGIVGLTTGGDVLTVPPSAYTLQRAYLSQMYDGEVYEVSWDKIQGREIENAPWLPLAGGTMSGYITLHADPQNPLHAATKQYVDALSAGLVPFPFVHAAEGRNNINLSTSAQLTIDNYLVQDGESFLVVAQSNPVQNGIYVATKVGEPGSWSYSRREDADKSGDMFKALIPVKFGDTFAGAMFYCTAPDNYIVGLDPIPFIQFLFPVGAKPGVGLVLNGNLIELGTPSTITEATNNTVTVNSHTHKLQLPTTVVGDMLIAGVDNVLSRFPRGGEEGKYKFLRQRRLSSEYQTSWSEIDAVHTKFTASGKILGRYSSGAGYAQEITVSTGISIAGGNLTNTMPMIYPGAGIAVSTGSAWATSIVNNSDNWNTAFGWGNHAGLYILKTVLENPGDMIVAGVNAVPAKLARGAEEGKYKFLTQIISSGDGSYLTYWNEIMATNTKFTTHNRILGRITEDGGYGEEIKIGAGLQISGTSLTNTAPMTYPATAGIAVAGADSWETSIALSETQTDKFLNQDGTWQKETDPVFTTWRDASRTQKYVFAAPNNVNSPPLWRRLLLSDITPPSKGLIVSEGSVWGNSIPFSDEYSANFLNEDGTWRPFPGTIVLPMQPYPSAGIPVSLGTGVGWRENSIVLGSEGSSNYLHESGKWKKPPDSKWNSLLDVNGVTELRPKSAANIQIGIVRDNPGVGVQGQGIMIKSSGDEQMGIHNPSIISFKQAYNLFYFHKILEGTQLLNILAYGANENGELFPYTEYGGGICFTASADWGTGIFPTKPTKFSIELGTSSGFHPVAMLTVNEGLTTINNTLKATSRIEAVQSMTVTNSGGAYYLGDRFTIGTWRVVRDPVTNKLQFQKRTSLSEWMTLYEIG